MSNGEDEQEKSEKPLSARGSQTPSEKNDESKKTPDEKSLPPMPDSMPRGDALTKLADKLVGKMIENLEKAAQADQQAPPAK